MIQRMSLIPVNSMHTCFHFFVKLSFPNRFMQHGIFCVLLLSCGITILIFSHNVTCIHGFFLLSSTISFCGCVIFIYFWFLQMNYCNHLSTSLSMDMCFHTGQIPRSAVSPMVNLCLILQEVFKLLCKVTVSFCVSISHLCSSYQFPAPVDTQCYQSWQFQFIYWLLPDVVV